MLFKVYVSVWLCLLNNTWTVSQCIGRALCVCSSRGLVLALTGDMAVQRDRPITRTGAISVSQNITHEYGGR